jgi:BirA family transcriptional regulator, biotin operon repressor / biotin---[acetyl-CoA-carboxylase] ligase
MKDINIHWLKSIDSTNSEAQRKLPNSPDLSVWFAEFQTAGRGQRGNKWESKSAENLTFSILFKPSNVLATNQFVISQVASLGIWKYLQSRGVHSKIKWPNDIYVDDNKICGVLIENTLSNDILSASIVGIGLNLNQKEFFGAPNPTSLSLILGKDLEIRDEFALLLESIVFYYDDYCSSKEINLDELYFDNMYRLNEKHYYLDLLSNIKFKGIIRGVDKTTARLIVELENGQLSQYAFKEIGYIL